MKMWFKTDILCCFCHHFLAAQSFKIKTACNLTGCLNKKLYEAARVAQRIGVPSCPVIPF